MSRAKLMTDAIDAFVVGCKADGIWDAIKSCCILAGWDGLAGALTPIKGPAPTNVNFVAGDYNRKTGLIGNGSTKYLNSNRANNADAQNDQHVTAYITTVLSAYAVATNPSTVAASALLMSSAFSEARFYSRGATSGDYYSAPGEHTAVGLVGVSRSSSDQFTARLNGSNRTSSLTSGAPSSETFLVFARQPVAALSTGRLAFYSIGSALDLALLDSRVSTLLTSIWRAVHPEFTVVTNPDAMDWIGRVYDAGGSVSVSTANAVNTFCNAIDTAGMRSKFLRLNLFAGNDLTSALVPLYRSSAYGGAVVGGATDTNNAFVASDYSDSLGLTGTGNNGIGAGSSKYLNTGLAPTAWPAISSFHASAFVFGVTQSGANQGTPVGVRNNSAPVNRWGFDYRQSTTQFHGGAGLSTNAPMPVSATNQHWLVSRESMTSVSGYINGVSQFQNTTDVTASLVARTNHFYVFAQNTDNTVNQYLSFRMGGYSLGTGLTQSEATSFNTAMQTLQTALGRQA